MRRRRAGVALGAALVVLAVVETVAALSAPLGAPAEEDWRAAAEVIRREFRTGDLIVAAPGWADPLMRLHLGDLVPLQVAGRMDAARFGRIWELSQRGAGAPEAAGLRAVLTEKHGRLTLRRYDRRPAEVVFDFVAGWHKGVLSRVDGDGRTAWGTPGPDGQRCPGSGYVMRQILEIDTAPRFALHTEPVGGATMVFEYDDVPLGRELAVAAGLHNVWLRKGGTGTVRLRVLADGRELGSLEASNRSGWTVRVFDTAALAGRAADVRFEVTADRPASRHLGFAAEARNP